MIEESISSINNSSPQKTSTPKNEYPSYIPFHMKSFWEKYYKILIDNKYNDWYFELQNYESKLINLNSIDREGEVLILGVGNSRLVEYLLEKRFPHVCMIDFSENLIQWVQNKYGSKPECEEWDFVCEDVTKLTREGLIPEDFYNIVIDKGCIDCILSEPNQEKAEENFKSALNEIKKVMTSDAIFYYISTSKTEKKFSLLKSVFFEKIDIEEISKISSSFI